MAGLAIIGVLHGRPMHGYEVARHFTPEHDLGIVLPLEMSHVYAILKHLHECGLLEGRRETAGARPPRTVFTVTPEAKTRLQQWLATPVQRLREVRLDLLLKLYFCRAAGGDALRLLLDAQIEECHRYLERMKKQSAACPSGSFARLVCEAKISPARATLDWLDGMREELSV